MFTTEAGKELSGNWNLKAICSLGHTVFRYQYHLSETYRCPHCGRDVCQRPTAA